MLKQKLKFTLFFVFALSAWFVFQDGSASAVPRMVPSQYTTIQGAINASSNGDVISVSPGVYRENLEIVGKYIELKSTGGYNSTTIVPSPGKTAIMIQNVPYSEGAPRVKVSGFKITEGNAPDGQGGGITIANSADPIIENCLINQNYAPVGGGIVVFNNSNPTIRNNYITYNDATNIGGGILVVKNSSPIIYGNYIQNNSVTGYVTTFGGSGGGGIYLENDPYNTAARTKPIIVNNTITNNHADFAGGGIMLRVGVDIIIEGNNISSNSASFGGALHVETEGSNVIIAKNTISGNAAAYNGSYGGSGYGGGIAIFNKSKTRVLQNQITNNQSSRGGAGIVSEENSVNTISGNTIAGNSVTSAATNNTWCGGGIYVAHSQSTLTNNIIRDNNSALGGGICMTNNSTVTATNNTIVKNSAITTLAPAGGGGLYIQNGVSATGTFTNNIFVLNNDYQIFEEGTGLITTTNNVMNNDNDGMYFSGTHGTVNDTNTLNSQNSNYNASGNLSGSPGFIDEPNNDYRLQAGGVAIDAGVSTGAPAEDYRKYNRPYNSTYDIGAYEYASQPFVKSPVYRFWSDVNDGHFYTFSATERNTMLSNFATQEWRYEYEVYDAYGADPGGGQQVFRFWSAINKAHFYTASTAERDSVIANYTDEQWLYEGPVFWAYPLSYSGDSKPVYRFWSPLNQNHFYTADEGEKNYVNANFTPSQWTFESSRFKVPR
jgi:parallel beta-helix repeat protein